MAKALYLCIMIINIVINCIPFLTLMLKSSLQDCPEEISVTGEKWPKSLISLNVLSKPTCYFNGSIVTRDCNGTHWSPELKELMPCIKKTNHRLVCPPGYHPVSNSSVSQHCYKIGDQTSWKNPCHGSGGATVVTDLTNREVDSLIASLKERYDARFFWIPAHRHRILMPVVWTVPGPNYGQKLQKTNSLSIFTSIWYNCAALDIEYHHVVTRPCSNSYPNLCIFLNDPEYPAQCPDGYVATRFRDKDKMCYGLEFRNYLNLTSFSKHNYPTCKELMGDNKRYNDNVMRFLFHKLASIHSIPDNEWCLFAQLDHIYNLPLITTQSPTINSTRYDIFINNIGTLNFQPYGSNFTCLACFTNILHLEPEMIFEYDTFDNVMYLSIYNPSSLFKYFSFDKGVQCFTNSYGPIVAANMSDKPVFHNFVQRNKSNTDYVEKIVYEVEVSNQILGEYWCVGHTNNLSLIGTDKILVSLPESNIHVFSLVVQRNLGTEFNSSSLMPAQMISNIKTIFQAENVFLMDILEYNDPNLLIVFHLQVQINNTYADQEINILVTYDFLKDIAAKVLPSYKYEFVNISSATHCLPSTTKDICLLHWDLTKLHHIAAPREFCLQQNGLPVQRHCLGSYVLGAYWGQVIGVCNANYVPSNKTIYLYDFMRGDVQQKDVARFLTDGLNYVLDDVNTIIPADIYYLAMSLQQTRELIYGSNSTIELCPLQQMAWAMNRIMTIKSHYLNLAQTLNATNVILDTVDDIIKLITRLNWPQDITINKTGYQIVTEPNYMVQISHPIINNISGIAISTIPENNRDFTKMFVQPLFKNTSFESVLSIQNLEVAAWIPEHILNTLRRNGSKVTDDHQVDDDITIIISAFYNDVIFQRLDKSNSTIIGRIISVSIPGYITNLEYPLPLIFKDNNNFNIKGYCGFWDFHSNSLEEFETGTWSNKGCFVLKTINNYSVCECYHLTHFGRLITNTPTSPVSFKNTQTLNIISLIGCFISILSVFGIWITALIFKSWRRKAGTKILLHLSLSIFITQSIFVVLNGNILNVEEENELLINNTKKILCISFGVALHYSVLVSFMWMLITGILQYVRFVKVLGGIRPSRFLIKSSLAAWLLPCIPVAIILIVDMENYVPLESSLSSGICYPRGKLLLTCVTLPVFLILVVNILIFILILFSVSRGLSEHKRKVNTDLIYTQMRLSIFLFFLLGLTWTFAFFSIGGRMLWSYLFCMFGTLQGFVLFIYFVICDPLTRNLWITLIKPPFVSKDSISDISINSFATKS